MFILIKWLMLTLVLSVIKMQLVFCTPPPCYFIFGDSMAESGVNNFMFTSSRANYPPYGIDFPNAVPTGRFTNGRTVVDIIGQLVGFPNFIPTYASILRGDNFLMGVNYASGATGIRPETGSQTGFVLSMDTQLDNHRFIISRMKMSQGNTTFTTEYLGKCLYTVGMGANDYINNYLKGPHEFYFTSKKFTPQAYANDLIRLYDIQLRALYNLGARKVAIFSIGLLGCTPSQIGQFGADASGCVDKTNNLVRLFDDQLGPLVARLNSDLPGASFTLINVTSIFSRRIPGITVANAPCCLVSNSTGLCIKNSVPCPDRRQYAFYDAAHPTETVISVLARNSYIAGSPSDASPFDIRTLVGHHD